MMAVESLAEHVVDRLFEANGYYFVISCPQVAQCDVQDLFDMMDGATEITYDQFIRKVGVGPLFDAGLAQYYDWPEKLLRSDGIDPSEADGSHLKMKDDFHIQYFKSTWRGEPCLYLKHSAIEYVFCRR